MKTLYALFITALLCLIATGVLLAIAFNEAVNLITFEPTTYQTGLYVESEQVQQTIDGKELQ